MMALTPATAGHVRALMAWFPDRRSCAIWGGPAFCYPFTESTFLADTRFRDLPSYVLVDEEGQVLAFGQYYERAGRCHFGRLVVSLFVIADNAPAIRLYERLGFAPAVYPEDDPDVRTYLYGGRGAGAGRIAVTATLTASNVAISVPVTIRLSSGGPISCAACWHGSLYSQRA